jgi:hypothetical protein
MFLVLKCLIVALIAWPSFVLLCWLFLWLAGALMDIYDKRPVYYRCRKCGKKVLNRSSCDPCAAELTAIADAKRAKQREWDRLKTQLERSEKRREPRALTRQRKTLNPKTAGTLHRLTPR